MAEAEVIFSGVREFRLAGEAMIVRAREAARVIVTRGSVILADAMKHQYRPYPGGQRTSRTGRVYYQGKPNFPAVPPKPTIRSGATVRSIRPIRVGAIGLDTWFSETGPTVNYERYPELGTKFIKVPFPAVRMGTLEAEPDIRELADVEYAKAVE